jgi:hypothetical protein
MSEAKVLTQEELEAVKKNKQDYNNLILSLGDIELQKNVLDRRKEYLFGIQSELAKKENDLIKELTEKYGNGSINMETGEVISE